MLAGLYHQTEVEMNRDHVMRRRDFLRGITSAGVAAGTLSWADLMSLQAANLRRRDMACIVLWMQGGPSQFETFSPKPNDAAGGETKAIPTSVPGIQIAENLPETAGVMDDVCLIRSVNSKEGSHPRASFLMHTGYVPTASVKHPELGAVVDLDVAILTTDDGVPTHENAVAYGNTVVVCSFRVEQAVIVDMYIVSDANLVWMSQDDVLPKGDVPPDPSQQAWVQLHAEKQAQGARNRQAQQRDRLVTNERPKALLSNDQVGVFP